MPVPRSDVYTAEDDYPSVCNDLGNVVGHVCTSVAVTNAVTIIPVTLLGIKTTLETTIFPRGVFTINVRIGKLTVHGTSMLLIRSVSVSPYYIR